MPHTSHPFGVTLFESHVYWTDWFNKSVYRSGKDGDNKIEEIRHGLSGALDIRSVSKDRQPYQWSPCAQDNGGCTHLCLYKYISYKCECPDKRDTIHCIADEIEVTTRPTDTEDYLESNNAQNSDQGDGNETSSKAKLIIIATAIAGCLLIIVVAAILCKFISDLIELNENEIFKRFLGQQFWF